MLKIKSVKSVNPDSTGQSNLFYRSTLLNKSTALNHRHLVQSGNSEPQLLHVPVLRTTFMFLAVVFIGKFLSILPRYETVNVKVMEYI